jgi:hypothetical protein
LPLDAGIGHAAVGAEPRRVEHQLAPHARGVDAVDLLAERVAGRRESSGEALTRSKMSDIGRLARAGFRPRRVEPRVADQFVVQLQHAGGIAVLDGEERR